MLQLERFTTEYVEAEDRMRLRASSQQGEVLELWLTQRLLGRLVVHGCVWLESQAPETQLLQPALHSFAQQAAQLALEQDPQPPVVAPAAEVAQPLCVLVCSVDVTGVEGQLVLCFKDAVGLAHAQLALAVQALRQWLCILRSQYRQAEWPMHRWPQWLQESATLPTLVSRSTPVLH